MRDGFRPNQGLESTSIFLTLLVWSWTLFIWIEVQSFMAKCLKLACKDRSCRIDCVCDELSKWQSSQRRSLIFAHNGVGPGVLQCTHAQYWIREMMETQSHHTIHVTRVSLCHLMRHEWPFVEKAPQEYKQVPEF